MTNVCFDGCSLTFGNGFDNHERTKYLYDQIVADYFNFKKTNIAVPGSGNYEIFLRSANAILEKKYQIVFIQWSALNRIWLSPGPEVFFNSHNAKFSDFTYRDLYITSKDTQKLKNLLLLLNHDYQNILDLIEYCAILCELAKSCSIKLYFINGLVPWTQDLINPLSDNLSQSLSLYSKTILDFDNRNDQEIIFYFSKLQEKFKSLDKEKWVNLFDSFESFSVDYANDDVHPGIESHKIMAEKIIKKLTQVDQKSES